jgi:hypothetical protein
MEDNPFLIFGLVALVFAAVGLLFLVLGVRQLLRVRRQRSWPSVKGTVRGTDIRQLPLRRRGRRGSMSFGDPYHYLPHVEYEYSVGGTTHSGDNIGIMPQQGYTRGGAERKLTQYKPGASVNVHYDPANPAESVLKPAGGGFVSIFMIFLGLLASLIGFGLLYLFGASFLGIL